jgi:hypothetical protein
MLARSRRRSACLTPWKLTSPPERTGPQHAIDIARGQGENKDDVVEVLCPAKLGLDDGEASISCREDAPGREQPRPGTTQL